MGLHRLPRKDTLFNNYLNGTAAYLQKPGASGVANWERLRLTAAEAAQWENFRKDWNSSYGKVVRNLQSGIRDSNATRKKNDDRAAFSKWVTDSGLNKLDRIAGSPGVTDVDRSVFNIRVRSGTRGSVPAITTSPNVSMKVVAGGIKFTCRVEHDSNRASRHPHAGLIEMKYVLVSPGSPPPASPAECNGIKLSTRATFRFKAGGGNAGKRLYAYLRWKNISDDNKSGPWTEVKTMVVSD